MTVSFGGVTLSNPTVASRVDDSDLRGSAPTGSGIVGLIGIAQGGKTNSPLIFTSIPQAAAVLRSGELLEGIKWAFDHGAWKVIAINIGGGASGTLATQGARTVTDGSANTLTFTSTGWGPWVNGIGTNIVAGGVNGKKVSIKYNGQLYSQDNLYRAALSVYYSGVSTVPVAVISATSGTGSVPGLDLNTAGAVDRIQPDFATYDTLQKLADYINGTGKWVAVINHPNTDTPTTDLDYIGSTATGTSSGAALVLQATLREIIKWVNGGAQSVVTVDLSASSSRKVPGNDSAGVFTNLSGAVAGGTTNNDWSAALDVLGTQDVDLVGVMSAAAAIHTMVKAHVESYSATGVGKERRAVLGGAAGETLAQAKARITATSSPIQSQRTALVWPGAKVADDNGVVTTRAPYYLAAAMLGRLAGARDVATSVSKQLIQISDFESDANRPSETDVADALASGVCIVQFVEGSGFEIAHAISTYTADQTYFARSEISTGRAADFTAKRVRAACRPMLVGKGPNLSGRIKAAADSELTKLAGEEIIVGDATNPAFKNLSVQIVNDLVYVDFQASPAIPANFILITAHLQSFHSP